MRMVNKMPDYHMLHRKVYQRRRNIPDAHFVVIIRKGTERSSLNLRTTYDPREGATDSRQHEQRS